jgi:(p)ppGpp synthase/HD superfamily hydrolase
VGKLEAELAAPRAQFIQHSPLTRESLAFATGRHSGQTRDGDDIPFVTHPLEVACLLHEAGYSDEVVAAGVLHDVLENTDAERAELDRRFGPAVTWLVTAVSDDPSIEDPAERKAALRRQVAEAGDRAAAIFAADKISKARELRARIGRAGLDDSARVKLDHYQQSLAMLAEIMPGHPLVDQLRLELAGLKTPGSPSHA